MISRMALVGHGYWGANLARNIRAAKNCKLVSVVETNQDAAERLRLEGVDVATDLDSVLGRPDIDGLVIATPAATHAEVAIAGLEAGKHVLVEKPLATRLADAQAIARAAAERGLVAMAGHTFLYSEPVRHLKSVIDEGKLGALRYLSFQRKNLGRIRSDCDAVWNFAPHDISIAIYLLGGEFPTSVSATGSSFLQEGVADVGLATLRFPRATMHLQVSWIDPVKTRLLTVVGSERMAVYDDVSADAKISIYDSGVLSPEASLNSFSSMADWQWRTRAGDLYVPRIPLREPLLVEVEHFADCCLSGDSPLSDAWHGAGVVAVLEALTASMREDGKTMAVESHGN